MQLIGQNQYTPSETLALDAMKGKKIKELKVSEMVPKLRGAVVQSLIILGQGNTMDNDTMKKLIDCLCYELKENKHFFTVDEIALAMDYGCKGKLCDLKDLPMPIISLHNILRFITLYTEKIRREAVHKKKENDLKAEKEINEAERLVKIAAFEREIEHALTMTPQEKDSLSIGLKSAYYRHLDKSGRVNLSVDEKKVIFDRAIDVYNSERTAPKGLRNPFLDVSFEIDKREKRIREIAESLAFDLL